MRLISALVVFTLLFASTCCAADLNYPYGKIYLNLPPAEDPFPGFGSYYTTINKGMASALWNPASLGKLKLSEFNLSTATTTGLYNIDRSTNVSEISGTFEVGADTGAGGKSSMDYGLFFRYPSAIGSGISTKEIEVKSNLSYATSVTGLNFSAAQKINDWLSVGFASRNPVEGGLALAGDFPLTGKMAMNFYGKNLGEMQVSTDGKLKYTFDSGGVITTPETTSPIWNGFLSQEAVIPFTSLTEFRNNVNIQSPYVGTIASHYGNLYAGLNFIPISANAQIDNDVRMVVSSDTPDPILYIPNFDPNNPEQGANWLTDPDQYGTQAGYSRKRIDLPNGEIIGNAKYRGFYSGSATRMDLGMMYDVTDWLTVGLVMENFGGATLNLKGNGLASYMSYRDVSTQEADSLFQPGGNSTWAPFTDRWITTFEAGNTAMYLEPEKNFNLPKKTRYGFALKKPWLIAFDIEQHQNTIQYMTSENNQPKEVTFSNISFIRLGVETQVFALPMWLRSNMTFMPKPTCSDASIEANLKDAYDKVGKYTMGMGMPVKFDLGTNIHAWGTELGGAFGFNGSSLISLIELDTTNTDLSKLVYYNAYVGKDAWTVNYISQVDPLSTAAAYSNKAADASGKKNFEPSDLKFMQTLGVTYRF